MPLAPDTRLGRYEIRQPLGAGGMGEVYLARDARLERTVALKILPADVERDSQKMRRFVQEARAASSLSHPNVAHIYEIEEEQGHHFIAMEYVEGETLRQRIRRAPLDLAEALDITIQVASALASAHEAGIVHRDIKPENIMIRRDGIVKVLDFGLAKLTEQPTFERFDTQAATLARVKTEPGVVMGTVTYMSPEQARGLDVDARTDTWSLGVVLYECVAGVAPFTGATPTDIIASILKTAPAPLTQYVQSVPVKLEEITAKALEKDREERYQGVKDLLVDLRRLKKRLEFEAEFERSVSPDSHSAPTVIIEGAKDSAQTKTEAAAIAETSPQTATPTSSVEYITSSIRRHRFATLLVAVMLLAALSVALYFASVHKTATEIDSIAVLPFENQNPETEYLSDGLTEGIINNLTKLPNLRVIARNSVFRYKGKETDLAAVGRELNVRAVLTGRITQRGDNLIVSAELTDLQSNKQVWGEQYQRKVTDAFAVQQEISRAISETLRLTLTGDERKQLAKRETSSPEAYQLYLKGRFYWNKRTEDGYQKAIDYFQQAINLDPSYALAYTGLADSYSFLSSQGIRAPKDVFPLARAAAAQAIALDDSLAEAHSSLGYVKLYYDWDWQGAEQEYKRAIELNPNYATPHHGYAYYLISTGRTQEAINEIKRAEELDPLSLIINTDHGEFYSFARRPKEAIDQLRKAIDMDSGFVRAHFLLARAYAQDGRCDEAIAEFQKARNLEDKVEMLGALGQGYASCGKKDEARKVLNELLELSKQHYVSPHWIASIYAGLGQKDEAFDWLDKAFDYRFGPLIYLKVNPIWDPLRTDPRFAERLKRVGLTPSTK